jgi:hypothetical protein
MKTPRGLQSFAFALALSLLAAGCGPQPSTPPPATTAPPTPNDPRSKIPTGVIPSLDRTDAMIDLSEVAKLYQIEESSGLGARDQVLKDIQRDNRPLYQRIQAGTYVLLRADPARAGNTILAYEKNAETQGGIVLVGYTPQRMTLQEFQSAPKGEK